MTRITQHYGITGPVPFLDVRVDVDNPVFLDPSAIRNAAAAGDKLAGRAQDLLVDFFNEVMRCRTSRTSADAAKGLSLLQRLHEPNETRLGLSQTGSSGHAFGDELGFRLWDVLRQPVFALKPVARRLEDLALVVDRVGDDLISDLTTRVIFEVMADFTMQMCNRYPAMKASIRSAPVDLWDLTTKSWIQRTVDLPYVAPHQLLLIPDTGWVFWRMVMDPHAFYNNFTTTTVQTERTTWTKDGKPQKPSKFSLNAEFPNVKGLNTDQTVKYLAEEDRDLIAEYREFEDLRYEALDVEGVHSRLS